MSFLQRERSAAARLPDYALYYYDALKAKFETLREPADEARKSAFENARRIAGSPRDQLAWSDLVQLDLSIVQVLDFFDLRLRIAELRSRLDGLVAPLPLELAAKLDTVKEEQMPALRAEAQILVTRVWHMRMARDARDRYVGELRRTVFWWMLGIVAVFIAISLPSAMTDRVVPLFVVIIGAGMLGALISFLRRLQGVVASPPNPDQSSDLSALANEKRAVMISLLVGAVFAIMLYVAFVGGILLISQELTPRFNPPKGGETGATFLDLVNKQGPKDAADYARVVLWSFIAGLFEQLVPDMLDRFAKPKK